MHTEDTMKFMKLIYNKISLVSRFMKFRFLIPLLSVSYGNVAYAFINNGFDGIVAYRKAETLFSSTVSHEKLFNVSVRSDRANDYEEYFELKQKTVKVFLSGTDLEPIEVRGEMSFYEARIVESEKSKVEKFLENSGVDEKFIHEIIEELNAGVRSSKDCKGSKSECVIVHNEMSFVVDYYNDSLRLFVPSSMFKLSEQRVILENQNTNMLVSRLYSSLTNNEDFSYFVNSQNVQGFYDGFLKYDLSSSEGSTGLYQLNYNHDFSNFAFTGGLISDSSRLGLAAQDSLISRSFVGLQVSNMKLLEIENHASKRFEFFSPIDGTLTVFNGNDEVIYQKYIDSGLNSVPYSVLPYGNYAIRYNVTKNSDVVFNGDGFISKSDAFDADNISFYAKLGKQQDSYSDKNELVLDSGISIPTFNQQSAIGNISYINEEFYLGFGYYANLYDYHLNGKYYIGRNANKGSLSLYSDYFNLSIEDVSVSDSDKGSYLGDNDYFSSYLGTSFQYGGIVFNAGANYYQDQDQKHQLRYNLGASYFFENGIGVNANYMKSEGEYNINYNISIPFSNGMSYSSNFVEDSDGSSISHGIRLRPVRFENLSIGGGMNYTDSGNDSNVDVHVNTSYINDHISSSAGFYSDSDNKTSYNASLSTTAYITNNSVYFDSSSYGDLSAIEVIADSEDINGHIEIKNVISGTNTKLDINESSLLTQEEYSKVVASYDFDNESYALQRVNIENREELDLLPGKVHYIRVKQQAVGQILVVSESSDAESFNCSVDDCISHEKVNDRVIKFQVRPNRNIRISNKQHSCFSGFVEQGKTKIGVCGS